MNLKNHVRGNFLFILFATYFRLSPVTRGNNVSNPLRRLTTRLYNRFTNFLLPFVNFFIRLIHFKIGTLRPGPRQLISNGMRLNTNKFHNHVILVSHHGKRLPHGTTSTLHNLLTTPSLVPSKRYPTPSRFSRRHNLGNRTIARKVIRGRVLVTMLRTTSNGTSRPLTFRQTIQIVLGRFRPTSGTKPTSTFPFLARRYQGLPPRLLYQIIATKRGNSLPNLFTLFNVQIAPSNRLFYGYILPKRRVTTRREGSNRNLPFPIRRGPPKLRNRRLNKIVQRNSFYTLYATKLIRLPTKVVLPPRFCTVLRRDRIRRRDLRRITTLHLGMPRLTGPTDTRQKRALTLKLYENIVMTVRARRPTNHLNVDRTLFSFTHVKQRWPRLITTLKGLPIRLKDNMFYTSLHFQRLPRKTFQIRGPRTIPPLLRVNPSKHFQGVPRPMRLLPTSRNVIHFLGKNQHAISVRPKGRHIRGHRRRPRRNNVLHKRFSNRIAMFINIRRNVQREGFLRNVILPTRPRPTFLRRVVLGLLRSLPPSNESSHFRNHVTTPTQRTIQSNNRPTMESILPTTTTATTATQALPNSKLPIHQ